MGRDVPNPLFDDLGDQNAQKDVRQKDDGRRYQADLPVLKPQVQNVVLHPIPFQGRDPGQFDRLDPIIDRLKFPIMTIASFPVREHLVDPSNLGLRVLGFAFQIQDSGLNPVRLIFHPVRPFVAFI
jgi:hypothetical protein